MKKRAPLIAFTIASMAAAVVAAWLGPQELDWLPGRFDRPVLAIELVGNQPQFKQLIEQSDRVWPHAAAVDTFRRSTQVDFAFIAMYTAMWTLVVLRRAGGAAYVGVGAIVLAGAADVVEDVLILQGLSSAGATASAVATAAIVKWIALVPGLALVAFSFWPDREIRDGYQLLSAAIGLLYAYAAILCLVGVAASYPVIERAGLPIAVAMVLQLVLFWRS